jgi:CRISPR/Cas system CSM-associated protein Csm3 (group 7 of RAMP superfamily)
MVEEDKRLKSNRTWIKWTKLDNGLSLKYHEKSFKKPGDEEELIKEIRLLMKGNNKAKEMRLKVAEPKRSRVNYTDAIDRVKRMKKWREWEGLESGANKTLKYHGRIYRKDIPDDEEKLMTNMINQMNYEKN